jgi:hypothetical protein
MNWGGSGLSFQYFLNSTEESHVDSQPRKVVSWKTAEHGTHASTNGNQLVMKFSDTLLCTGRKYSSNDQVPHLLAVGTELQ